MDGVGADGPGLFVRVATRQITGGGFERARLKGGRRTEPLRMTKCPPMAVYCAAVNFVGHGEMFAGHGADS